MRFSTISCFEKPFMYPFWFVISSIEKYVLKWTLAYPATTGPDHDQISEIAGYVNHHAVSVYY